MRIQIFFLYGLLVAALPVDWGAVRIAHHEGVISVAVEADVLQPAEGGLDVGEVQASPFVSTARDSFHFSEPRQYLLLLDKEFFVYLAAMEQPEHILVVFLGVGGITVCHGKVSCVAVDGGYERVHCGGFGDGCPIVVHDFHSI